MKLYLPSSHMAPVLWRALLLAALLCLAVSASVMAADTSRSGAPHVGLSQPHIAVGIAAAAPEQVLYLVRATLLALDEANRTGNYSVLRDGAAPSFQHMHSTADLALIFADLRRHGIPLTAAAIAVPELAAEPVIDSTHILVLTGYLPTAPLRVAFDLRFQAVDGGWRLAAISVGARPLPVVPPAAARP